MSTSTLIRTPKIFQTPKNSEHPKYSGQPNISGHQVIDAKVSRNCQPIPIIDVLSPTTSSYNMNTQVVDERVFLCTFSENSNPVIALYIPRHFCPIHLLPVTFALFTGPYFSPKVFVLLKHHNAILFLLPYSKTFL